MRPDHIKEGIPDLVTRMKFENLFTKFLHKYEEDKRSSIISNAPIIVYDARNSFSLENCINEEYNKYPAPIFDPTSPIFNAETSINSSVTPEPQPSNNSSIKPKTGPENSKDTQVPITFI